MQHSVPRLRGSRLFEVAWLARARELIHGEACAFIYASTVFDARCLIFHYLEGLVDDELTDGSVDRQSIAEIFAGVAIGELSGRDDDRNRIDLRTGSYLMAKKYSLDRTTPDKREKREWERERRYRNFSRSRSHSQHYLSPIAAC